MMEKINRRNKEKGWERGEHTIRIERKRKNYSINKETR
jgi:hypothetical protein